MNSFINQQVALECMHCDKIFTDSFPLLNSGHNTNNSKIIYTKETNCPTRRCYSTYKVKYQAYIKKEGPRFYLHTLHFNGEKVARGVAEAIFDHHFLTKKKNENQ